MLHFQGPKCKKLAHWLNDKQYKHYIRNKTQSIVIVFIVRSHQKQSKSAPRFTLRASLLVIRGARLKFASFVTRRVWICIDFKWNLLTRIIRFTFGMNVPLIFVIQKWQLIILLVFYVNSSTKTNKSKINNCAAATSLVLLF